MPKSTASKTPKSSPNTSNPAIDHATILARYRDQCEVAFDTEGVKKARELADRWNAGDYTCQAEIESLPIG